MHAECSRMFQNVSECMQVCDLACSYISLYAVTEACMQLHKLACSYISLHAVTWACMQLHKHTCSYISLHAVTWACMQFLELACSSFLRLSSSQEFRSACWSCKLFDCNPEQVLFTIYIPAYPIYSGSGHGQRLFDRRHWEIASFTHNS